MDWVFRIFAMTMAMGLAALVSSAVAMMIFNSLEGAEFVRLPIASLLLTVGLYASIYVIVSCLTDDRDEYPPRSKAY